jgi:dTDP-4-dehydrorhamnose 3,5-epimerase
MNVTQSELAGVYLVDLDVFADDRGHFREAWQAKKMEAAGLPAFRPLQQNVSASKKGVIRGIHAEAWEKYIHVVDGTVFAAILDLREDSPTFSKVATFELDNSKALFLPSGMGNSFQVTSEQACYSYLVTDFWSADAPYRMVAFDDPDLNVPWPITGDAQIVSAKDRQHPKFREIYPHWQPTNS